MLTRNRELAQLNVRVVTLSDNCEGRTLLFLFCPTHELDGNSYLQYDQ